MVDNSDKSAAPRRATINTVPESKYQTNHHKKKSIMEHVNQARQQQLKMDMQRYFETVPTRTGYQRKSGPVGSSARYRFGPGDHWTVTDGGTTNRESVAPERYG